VAERGREPAHGLARRLSKLGLCSRSEAARWILAGRVRLNGRIERDPEAPTRAADRIEVDEQPAAAAERVYLMLNKPRGLVTTRADERGRRTVYDCLAGLDLPHLGPVGRLDQASEGLLLFSNDPEWAAAITAPGSGLLKRYHVKVAGTPDPELPVRLVAGVVEDGEPLRAHSASWLRTGERSGWLEIVLDEGRNRHIRRMLAALDREVLRLVRVAIGPLELGELPKGASRRLSPAEVAALGAKKTPGGRPGV
jgi:23S rRNA pseudouridine2605 synthase